MRYVIGLPEDRSNVRVAVAGNDAAPRRIPRTPNAKVPTATGTQASQHTTYVMWSQRFFKGKILFSNSVIVSFFIANREIILPIGELIHAVIT